MSAKTATGSIKELARNSIEFVFLTYIFNNKKHIKLQPFLADAQRSVLIPEITHRRSIIDPAYNTLLTSCLNLLSGTSVCSGTLL